LSERFRVGLIAALAVITIAFAVAGWVLKPSSTTPPPVPTQAQTPEVRLSILSSGVVTGRGPNVPAFPDRITLDTTIIQESESSTRLRISASASLPGDALGAEITWRADVAHFTGFQCPPAPPKPTVVPLRETKVRPIPRKLADDPAFLGLKGWTTGLKPEVSTVENEEPFGTLELCWHHAGPLTVEDPYLSAAFPSIPVFLDRPSGDTTPTAMTLTRTLQLAAHRNTTYTLQVGSNALLAADEWVWSSEGDAGSATVANSYRLPVTAVDLREIQRDDQRIFVSGILWGIAGAALVALFVEVVGPMHRRRARATRSSPPDAAS
jgi:hypothetical protein